MSKTKHVSEVLNQLVLNDPFDPYAQLMRHCPLMQIMMLHEGYMELSELSEDEKDRLGNFVNLEDLCHD